MTNTRNCTVCGSVVAISHREYLGHGQERVVWRCRGCGSETKSEARPAEDRKRATASKKKPIDEGPPHNPVLDSATAEALRKLMQSDS